jgi:DNA invertase Pin-like site-specific DNA recombinase
MPCDLPVKALRDLIALLDDLKAQGVATRSLTEAIDTEIPTGRACGNWSAFSRSWNGR